ncbi:5-formyltetrahydrofolate cyclo-ligase [Natrarchaeobius chitinivorans]|uniref:5-formyltetrahydrofolate cyclo-ligase n=1 Tax=Natrarchaeobius chitinivorans TaxID=1679083 RepID=A0A3N6P3Q6_NATCH|nr:5-formyltetrahydrofolate cyclo-ligase [Natrarchaeobius chitinivorans]RQG92409.1 5-formyltetrahydrofolate cyclo-ligase [Natrarchaeobius chitinivorans]
MTDGDRRKTDDEREAASDDLEKDAIRERVWDDLEESGTARFPFPPHGRIPNFEGAKTAADRLADQPEWIDADAIKANPDAPQLPVRRRALREGKTVYMAVPRLRDEDCFLRLDPDELEDYDAATTVSGSSSHGVQVGPEQLERIDLVVSGSVAVSAPAGGNRSDGEAPASGTRSDGETGDRTAAAGGGRIGKGEGYSDLEYAILRDLELVDDETTVATTVHERQLIDADVELADHDVPMDLIVTPDRVLRPDRDDTPDGIDWDLLKDDRLDEIPVLKRLDERRG